MSARPAALAPRRVGFDRGRGTVDGWDHRRIFYWTLRVVVRVPEGDAKQRGPQIVESSLLYVPPGSLPPRAYSCTSRISRV
eukprot:1599161-Prymnesium_polylepis.2